MCKVVAPILEAALVLAVSATTEVKKIYQAFLWIALGIGNKDTAQYALSEYLTLAKGENGKLMLSLVQKTLSKIESVEDVLWTTSEVF